MRRFLRDNGLSVALFALFLVSLIGQALTGWRAHTEELRLHAQPELLTVFLVQKGSSESKKPGEDNPEDEAPHPYRDDPDAPWPVHRGGLLLKLYSHSLSIALVALFLGSFWLHLAGSTRRMNEEALQHQQPTQTMAETLADPEFWYESFQNWQSEFLSIALLLVLGIYLRERGSPESKPVAAPHAATGH